MAIYLCAKGRTSPPAKTIGHRESINPTLAVNLIMAIYLRAKGRTSPPAKTIGHGESINPTLAALKLVAKYLVMAIYSNMLQKKRKEKLPSTWRGWRTYLIIEMVSKKRSPKEMIPIVRGYNRQRTRVATDRWVCTQWSAPEYV